MKKTLLRGMRNGLSLAIMGGVALYQNDPRLIMFAPLINMFFKFAREKWGIKYLPL